tara:strand:- start:2739 stop:3476 length:738 start_codon:yes stop_codon:yes gene_type:complete
MSEEDAAVEAAAEDGRDFVTQEDVEKVEQKSERPEWLPEKFNSPEDLAKSYNELSQKLGSKDEDIRNQLIEEIQAEAFADRPETAGDYQLPDIINQEEAVDNDLLRWWSEHSFNNGFSQEEFEEGIKIYADSVLGSQPSYDEEVAKLGDNAEARIDAASLWANKFFPESALPAIEKMCESHEGIIALETMMANMKDGSFAGDTASASELNEADLRKMMDDPKYWKDRDPHLHKQVAEGFKRIYRS